MCEERYLSLDLESTPRLGYRLTCTDPERRRRFARALRLAVKLANDAAQKLTTSPVDKNISRLFVFFFGTTPEYWVSWAKMTAGALVAHRFKTAARELAGARRVTYTCEAGVTGHCGAGTNAVTSGPVSVRLCDGFWINGGRDRTEAQMAGTLLHEGLHAVYRALFSHAERRGVPRPRIAECRRDNTRCFHAFALRAAGYGADRYLIPQCRRSAAQCTTRR